MIQFRHIHSIITMPIPMSSPGLHSANTEPSTPAITVITASSILIVAFAAHGLTHNCGLSSRLAVCPGPLLATRSCQCVLGKCSCQSLLAAELLTTHKAVHRDRNGTVNILR